MDYHDYKCLRVKVDRNVVFVTIDHPPMNLLDLDLVMEIGRFGQEVSEDEDIRVIVFDSADPDFFVSHGDVEAILGLGDVAPPKSESVGFVHGLLDRFRTMPKISIAKVEGAARGGGSEFALAMDMRFGAIGKAVFGQPEVSMGIIPGAGGTQRLPRLLGQARALEIITGCDDFPAELAERYGYINRALHPDELGPFVDALAYRIATFPVEAITAAKAAVNAVGLSMEEGLIQEEYLCHQLMVSPEARRRMNRFIESGGQDRNNEIDFQAIINKLTE
jgi:enoyl-CoA hydratase/carnithine racemase